MVLEKLFKIIQKSMKYIKILGVLITRNVECAAKTDDQVLLK